MNLKCVCCIALIAGAAAWAQDDGIREKLIGAWQTADHSAAWTLAEQGDGLHLTSSQGDKTVAEFACNLGQECQIKDNGKKAKVTMYFNGPKLIVIETRGDEVVKYRFGLDDKGTALQVENIPVTPSGKAETVTLTRQQDSTAKAAIPKP